jgi:hypothetical protein
METTMAKRKTTIRYCVFPQTSPPPEFLKKTIRVFEAQEETIATEPRKTGLPSDSVLSKLRPGLVDIGYEVENGKSAKGRIHRPVFFGENGAVEKAYSIDAYQPEWKCGMEVEAGRAIGGNAVYRDLIQSLVMVDLDWLIIAVPNIYRYAKTKTRDYDTTINIAKALYGHTRLDMPYRLAVVGY